MKKCIFLIFLVTHLFANASKEIFAQFPNKWFIESGSYQGGGIQAAIDCGFEKIYSIEILPQYYQICSDRFFGYNNVKVILGDSTILFSEILKDVDSSATFWLDAHFCSYDGKRNQKDYLALTTSLEKELLAIKEHPIKTHTILIDDVRLLNTEHMENFSLDYIISIVKSINPDYNITFIDGSFPKDILVAYP